MTTYLRIGRESEGVKHVAVPDDIVELLAKALRDDTHRFPAGPTGERTPEDRERVNLRFEISKALTEFQDKPRDPEIQNSLKG